ncbi:MAG: hypothetical protein ACTHK8_16865 [Ginsengibacter sp.]
MNAHSNFSSAKRSILFLVVLLFAAVFFMMPASASVIPASSTPATIHQPSDPFQTAAKHAEMAVNAKSVKEIQMHLHHVLNCLEGKSGKDYNASFGDPCNGQGALATLKNGTGDKTRADNAIALARVGVNLQDEKPARLVAQAVHAILSESK